MDTMARTGHKKAPRRNPPANEGRRYRLYPSGDADQVMIGWGHTRRAVRNLALEQRRIAWRHGRKTLRRDEQSSALTEARAEIDWIRDFPAQAGQQVLRQLDAAYDNWWDPEHPARAPTFEKRSSTLRFSLPGQAIELRRISKHWGEVRLPKIGWQRFRWSRSPGGLICNATFTKHAGSWYVAFGVATDRRPASKNAKPGCGVDFGVACSAYASDEDEPRTMQRSLTIGEERRLVGLERRKPRQVAFAKKHNHGRYSKRLRRTIAEIAGLRARQARRRLDFTHKLTTDLAKNHGYVGTEDLSVKNMTGSARGTSAGPGTNVAAKAGLNRGILDNTPGERRRQLDYKCPWYGSTYVPVPAPGTSQTCAKCGARDPANRPGCGRIFACVACGHQAHADKNAAEVIDLRARQIIAGGHPVKRTGRRKPSPGRKARGGSVNHPQDHGPAVSGAA